MRSEGLTCVRLNVPELYARKSFAAWVRRWAGKGLATWHHAGKGEMGEFSDVFVTYDRGEGSDSPHLKDTGMPARAWEAVRGECERLEVDYALLWLTNFPV